MTAHRCTLCGRPRTHTRRGYPSGAHDWCATCYSRWQYQGKPADGPRPPHAAATGRAADARELRDAGHTIPHIAMRIGVTERQIWRYLAHRAA